MASGAPSTDNDSGQNEELAGQIGSLSLQSESRCDHGLPRSRRGEKESRRALAAFKWALNEAANDHTDPVSLHAGMIERLKEKNIDHLWRCAAKTEWMRSQLLYLGTEYLLADQDRFTVMAATIAYVLSLTDYLLKQGMILIARDIVEDTEREATRYFAKRIGCKCLKDKYNMLKSQPGLGRCSYCRQVKVRKELKLCEGSNTANIVQ